MLDPKVLILLVSSTHQALLAEEILLQAGFDVRLTPVPRELASDCGVCLRLRPEEKEQASRLLAERGVELKGLHRLK